MFYRLIEDVIERYTFTGTPTQILTDLLIGTDFTVGTIDFTDVFVFSVNKTASKYTIILELAKALGGEIDFNNFEISILNSIGQDNGYKITIGKNLKSIEKIIDNRGDLKIYYSIDLVNIFRSEEFKNKGLKDLEKVNVGDTVRVIDEKMNIDVSLKVIELSKDVLDDRNLKVTLSNVIEFITDTIYINNLNAVKRDEKVYGVTINDDVGIEIERVDQFAKVKFNADELAMQVGDGAGNYTNAVYFDVLEALYKFIGILEVSNTSNVTVKIDPNGANIFEIKDGATDLFTVSNAGVATFKGTINTLDDAIIGDVLRLGADGTGAILFGPGGFGYPRIDTVASNELVVTADTISLDASGTLELNGAALKVLGATGATGSGTNITVLNGIVTSIS